MDTPRNKLGMLQKELRSMTPSQSFQSSNMSPSSSFRSSSAAPLGAENRLDSKAITRKDSMRMFADSAMIGQQQKKLALQAKLVQMKAQGRRESFLQKGGIKKVMSTPTIVKAFQRHKSPFVKFRRVARAVKLLIQVCHVCKSLLENSVSQEAWFALVDNLAAAAALTSDKKKGGAFVTYVPNETQGELEQLSFDVAEYMRHKKAEDYLTDDIRSIMKQRPGTRTDDQLVEVVRCLKNICKSFNEYPLSIQKDICQMSFYDKYGRNRVILRQGLPPDGIYFLLSGLLVEKPEGRKQPEEIDAGQKFGEEELICGSSRRATVLTKDDVEILFLHRFDYRVIFDMSTDSTDKKHLDICKNDAVFQHFPMQKLMDNPGTWSTLKYKYGRLIVKDSNDIEWIYVIKSGEARVLKHLEPGRVDVKARRKKIQQTMEEQSSYHKKKKILDFIADGNGRKSCYAPSNYHPGLRRTTLVADSSSKHKPFKGDTRDIRIRSQSAVPSHVRGNKPSSENSRTRPMTTDPKSRKVEMSEEAEKENIDHSDDKDKDDERDYEVIVTIDDEDDLKNRSRARSCKSIDKELLDDEDLPRPSTCRSQDKGRFLQTPHPRSAGSQRSGRKSKNEEESMALPPFVQIETLHPGHTFGLRSCLEHDERGPAVSLVSGECEVLAINKKFFMKHCDDALLSLIRLKAKPFPSQTELVDRLDANMQWEEFKQATLKDFLKHRVRVSR